MGRGSWHGRLFRCLSALVPRWRRRPPAHELQVEQLGEWLSRIKGLQINPDAAEFLATVWVDYTLFAQAVADGSLPDDSAAVAAAMWPEVAEIKADQLVRPNCCWNGAQMSEETADSHVRWRREYAVIPAHPVLGGAVGHGQRSGKPRRQDAGGVLRDQGTAGAPTSPGWLAQLFGRSGEPKRAGVVSSRPARGAPTWHRSTRPAWVPWCPKGRSAAWSYTPVRGPHPEATLGRPRSEGLLVDWLRETVASRRGSTRCTSMELGEAKNLEGVRPARAALMRQGLDDERGR